MIVVFLLFNSIHIVHFPGSYLVLQHTSIYILIKDHKNVM